MNERHASRNRHREQPKKGDYATTYEDKCLSCSGVLKTFFTEGKWKPPVVHPD